MSELQGWTAGGIVALLLIIAERVGVPSSTIRLLFYVFLGGLFGIWLHS